MTCAASTPNHRNRLTVRASPLEARLVAAAESGMLLVDSAAQALEERFGWDILAAKGLWAFGPPPLQASQDNKRLGLVFSAFLF